MDDAFTPLRRAVGLLPEDAVAENGQTVGDVREDVRRQEWEMVLGVLEEIGDVHPVSVDFWELLAEAARQMRLDRSRRWCQWRGWEVQHGTVRATLSLLDPADGGRRTADVEPSFPVTVGSDRCGTSAVTPRTKNERSASQGCGWSSSRSSALERQPTFALLP
ncbi:MULTISPECIES: hypothetical protein [unclassified Streptomyces]|uniref:hypothetical protein n=1 Tax=unclassified Streptomyces TaxID=2593676 RepID=UPI001EF9855F|nr:MULTISPECIES: hypothetical protein [unclassified Streptomyces]